MDPNSWYQVKLAVAITLGILLFCMLLGWGVAALLA
jgi:hypothetical protein